MSGKRGGKKGSASSGGSKRPRRYSDGSDSKSENERAPKRARGQSRTRTNSTAQDNSSRSGEDARRVSNQNFSDTYGDERRRGSSSRQGRAADRADRDDRRTSVPTDRAYLRPEGDRNQPNSRDDRARLPAAAALYDRIQTRSQPQPPPQPQGVAPNQQMPPPWSPPTAPREMRDGQTTDNWSGRGNPARGSPRGGGRPRGGGPRGGGPRGGGPRSDTHMGGMGSQLTGDGPSTARPPSGLGTNSSQTTNAKNPGMKAFTDDWRVPPAPPNRMLRPGMIIRALVYERPYLEGLRTARNELAEYKRTNDDEELQGAFKSKDGVYFEDCKSTQPLLQKKRFLVVVRIGTTRIIALPCYTHKGRGANGTGYSREEVGIRDDRAWPIGRQWVRRGVHEPLITRNMTHEYVIKAETTADMSNPMTFAIDDPSWTIVGDIRKDSFIHLKRILSSDGWNLISEDVLPDDEDGNEPVEPSNFQGYHHAASVVNAPIDEALSRRREDAARRAEIDAVQESVRAREAAREAAQAERERIRAEAANAVRRPAPQPTQNRERSRTTPSPPGGGLRRSSRFTGDPPASPEGLPF
ncbi:uncharacterized protein AB675_8271 [Cyphellophora attinorum]|uniref:Uncharacterized protein n=1 Tax=Cyphellophora attinorum TaxID=1664694 RepID=A0A0N1P1Y7_9EURO|nr:uncharacterized protein AB675_8271 [Phialophora attinorum]KPI44344.1 hypothetical protein AB675_8271 [Phialophora attinorum]